nr:retrotransposon protein, putative, Ty1-copia subclass [Tanacetum cinerariifolium]
MTTLNSKEIKERSKAKGDDDEGLYVRGRTDHRNSRQSRGKLRSNSRGERLKCYIFQSKDNLKRNCLKNNRKKSTGKVKVINGSSVVLSGIQRDNCVYSLDGHAMAGELNASAEEKDSLAQLVENQTGRTVEKLRTYNGLEFRNHEFEQLCIERRIARHITVVGTPQKNGLAERMNRTLMDKVRCLLIHFGLPKTFWVEATCTAAYLINRSPSTSIEKKTPMEMWLGHSSDYGMLRIFGCVLYPYDKQEEEDTHEPLIYHDAVACEDTSKWKASIKEEMDSLRKNKTWELVDHPAGKMLVSCKWLFKIKKGIESVQNPRQWYRRFDEYMLSNEFKRSSFDRCVYYRSYAPGEYIYLFLYVDDMLIACKSKAEIESTKYLLKKKFDMKELEEANKILGMEIIRDQNRKILTVTQSGMSKVPYANTVGSLRYLMVCTRPDTAYASSDLVDIWRIWVKIIEVNFEIFAGNCKRGFGVWDISWQPCELTGFVDSDYAKDPDKDAEYMALTEAVKEAIWLSRLLEELDVELNTVVVNCDNQGAIHLSRNHVFRERTKHINVRYHFIREVLEAKTVKVLKVGTEHNAADALTKVNLVSFNNCIIYALRPGTAAAKAAEIDVVAVPSLPKQSHL